MSKQTTKKISPKLVNALFGISKSDLVPIVEKAVQSGPITSLDIQLAHENVGIGMASETLVPTFIYQTASGETGETRIFVKRQLLPENQEVAFYLAAKEANVPTPHYYGHRIGPEGEEILFLEFLPEYDVNDQNEAEVRELVSLIARINTAPCAVTHLTYPPPFRGNKMCRKAPKMRRNV